MTGIDQATKRMEDAVVRLETELKAKVAAMRTEFADQLTAQQAQVARTASERDEMARRLARAEAELEQLREAAEAAGARLDATMDDLRGLLGESDARG